MLPKFLTKCKSRYHRNLGETRYASIYRLLYRYSVSSDAVLLLSSSNTRSKSRPAAV